MIEGTKQQMEMIERFIYRTRGTCEKCKSTLFDGKCIVCDAIADQRNQEKENRK